MGSQGSRCEAELGGREGHLQWDLREDRGEAGLDRGAISSDAHLAKSLPTPAGALNTALAAGVHLGQKWMGLYPPSYSVSPQPSSKVASFRSSLDAKSSIIKKPLTPKDRKLVKFSTSSH